MHRTLRRLKACAVLAAGVSFIVFLCVCDKGSKPIGPTDRDDSLGSNIDVPPQLDTIQWRNGEMHLVADPSRLLAAFGDTARVTVTAYDDFHNPIVGRQVTFRSNVGIISPASAMTDDAGRATAKFVAVPVNTEALIIARLYLSADSIVQRSTNITLSGLNVFATPDAYNALLGQSVPVTLRVEDGAGKSVASDTLFLTGAFRDTLVTLGNGTASTALTRNTPGAAGLTVRSRKGALDTVTVLFWTEIPDTVTETHNRIRQMRIYSSRSQLSANNTDSAMVTVILIDENNNPAAGDTIRFSCDIGVIGALAVVDATGRASVTLRSAPINGTCTIRAISSGNRDTVSTQVLFGGISLKLTPTPPYLKVGQYALLEALLLTASGAPIGGDLVTFTVSGGGFFADGSTMTRIELDPVGKAQIRLSSTVACTALVRATTLNTRDSATVIFSNNTLTLTSDSASIQVGGSFTVITARYVNGFGQPVDSIPIRFGTSAGTLLTVLDTTNDSGYATTVLYSAGFASPANVVAQASDAAASVRVNFHAAAPAAVILTVTPDNIQINGGEAKLIAVVLDAQGNRVSGEKVNFKILEGPGGGEIILEPLVTLTDGEASTLLKAGAVPGVLLGTKVAAYIGGVADTTKLTISGRPYSVSVARPQTDTITVEDAGFVDSSVFDFFIGAVVKDINGNPVEDDTPVHFSAAVAGMCVHIKTFHHWERPSNGVPYPVYFFENRMIPFEDLNNNFRMDPGIDLKLDFKDDSAARGDDVNGDGVCDYSPGVWDFWWDFNGNDSCDPGVGEEYYKIAPGVLDSNIFQDLNGNGVRDTSELLKDHYGNVKNGVCDLPASRDFRHSLWDAYPSIFNPNFRFDDNNFSVVIGSSAVTKGGVAYTRITYPRQFARKLYVLVDAECRGLRDTHAEPFLLVVVKK